MPSKSPTQRALEILRGHGFTAAVVEKWNAPAKIRQDLFGFADVLAVCPGRTVAVQATSADHVANRLAKLTEEDSEVAHRVWDCLRAGWSVEVWGLRPKPDRFGSTLLARSLVLDEDQTEVRVVECSLAIEGPDAPPGNDLYAVECVDCGERFRAPHHSSGPHLCGACLSGMSIDTGYL